VKVFAIVEASQRIQWLSSWDTLRQSKELLFLANDALSLNRLAYKIGPSRK